MQSQIDALEAFNNKFDATLIIELSEPRELISPNLLNEMATPSAKITSLSLDVVVWDKNNDDDGEPREPTRDELEEVVLVEPSIIIGSYRSESTEHKAPNNMFFRAKDLLDAIKDHERLVRGDSEWFGGIDCHHIFFEGLHKQPDGSYCVDWGS